MERDLTISGPNWREQAQELQALLELARTELIEAETELAERQAAVNAFDFQLRARLGSLSARLDTLQAEIQQYRRQLRQLQDDWDLPDELDDADEWAGAGERRRDWEYFKSAGAAPAGDDAPPAGPPPATLSPDQKSELRQLYRRLARRFHPDLAIDDTDRAYRTDIMAAVNSAYKAGNLARLRELMLEPEAGRLDHARDDAQLVAALRAELARCHRRLEEIRGEMARLGRQQASRLLRRAQQAEAEGGDLLAAFASQLKAEIARKLVERDVLKVELEDLAAGAASYSGAHLADAIYDLGLEFADEEFLAPDMIDWLEKRRGYERQEEEDILDDLE